MTKLTPEVLQRTLDVFNEHGRNMLKASEALDISRATFQNRLKRAQEHFKLDPEDIKARGVGGNAANPNAISKTEAQAFVLLFKQNGANKTRLARELGMGVTLVERRLHEAKVQHGVELSQEDTAKSMASASVERTLRDDIVVAKEREIARLAKSRLKDSLRQLSHIQTRIDQLECAARSSATPASWNIDRTPAGKEEHIPMLFTSDFQVGEVIREEETEHGYGYDLDTFRRRYRAMIQTTVRLAFEHVGKDWTYPGIIYVRGGDTVSGGIHEELAETDEGTPIECVEIAFEEEAAGIRHLADAFGRVDVKDCGGGNHDRSTHKTRCKKTFAHSYDRLVGFMLRREFATDDRVHFQISESMDVFFPIYNRNMLLTHGDRIGSRGGQGFVGPAATVMRGAQKVMTEQAALGRHVDMVLMGHFHTPFWLDWVMVNGCMPGYSEFAKANRMRPSAPQQWLTFNHPTRGMVDLKPIILTDA